MGNSNASKTIDNNIMNNSAIQGTSKDYGLKRLRKEAASNPRAKSLQSDEHDACQVDYLPLPFLGGSQIRIVSLGPYLARFRPITTPGQASVSVPAITANRLALP